MVKRSGVKHAGTDAGGAHIYGRSGMQDCKAGAKLGGQTGEWKGWRERSDWDILDARVDASTRVYYVENGC